MVIFLRNLRSHHFYKHLELQSRPPFLSPTPHSPRSLLRIFDSGVFSSTSHAISRPMSLSAASFQEDFDVADEHVETDLIDLQKNGSDKNAVESTVESKVTSKSTDRQSRSPKKKKETKRKPLHSSTSQEIEALKEKIRNLERDVKILKANRGSHTKMEEKAAARTGQVKSEGLYSLFVKPRISDNKPAPQREKKSNDVVELRSPGKLLTELSPEMLSFVNCLYEEGYLSNANFLKDGQLDFDCFSNDYFQNFVKSAAERFGHSHQDIAKWLSGSDLKKVALFGCPNVDRKIVFAAKRLRTFFSIEEDIVCRACKLKNSCKFVNQRVCKTEKVDFVDALRVITMYGSESVPPQMIVSDDMKLSINKLLKEVVNLSKGSI